ncbi:MAG TPA: helix-turn-helix domain-containing protein [Myxococcales bacterium]|nr:helix-turn-helix domain-containing protein [Myxococcales bacterium]
MSARQSEHICVKFQSAVDLLARRWTPIILQLLLQRRSLRYSDLYEQLQVVSEKVLIQRLKEMEQAGLIERRVINVTPVRVEYELSEKGRALGRVIGGIQRWADEWIAPPQH